MKQIAISGVIGWDVMAADIRDQLKSANGDDVELVISSPGGLVSEGLEIYNLVRNYTGKTVARLSGYAMSMASYIPLAADRIVAEDNAIYMIHNVRGGVLGDHNAILKYGAVVKSMSAMLGKAYAKRTGKDAGEIGTLMDQETYFFGEEMLEHGFADEIITTGEEQDKQTAMATASVVFNDFEAKLAGQVNAVKEDLQRAAALAETFDLSTRAQAKAAPASKGEKAMDLKKLKADHPDLVAAIAAEAREGMVTQDELQAQLTEAQAAGAENERKRISDVRAQLVPGHEKLIETMAFDGQSSAADAAMAIVAAEQKRVKTAAAGMDDEANETVAASNDDGQGQKKMAKKDFKKLDQAAQGAFIRSGGQVVE